MIVDATALIRPFAFDRVFDDIRRADEATSVDDLRLRIAALEAEIALARSGGDDQVARARADGFDAGLAHARAERDAALLVAADALHAAIEGIEANLSEIADEAAREAAEVPHAAAELLAGHALAAVPTAAIDAAIGRVLGQVARGQDIRVTVAPDLVEEMERLIAARQSADRRHLALTVVGDATIAAGDARIDWDHGGVVLDSASRASAVREALVAILPHATH